MCAMIRRKRCFGKGTVVGGGKEMLVEMVGNRELLRRKFEGTLGKLYEEINAKTTGVG